MQDQSLQAIIIALGLLFVLLGITFILHKVTHQTEYADIGNVIFYQIHVTKFLFQLISQTKLSDLKVCFIYTFQTIIPIKRKFLRQLSICCYSCLIKRQQIENWRRNFLLTIALNV